MGTMLVINTKPRMKIICLFQKLAKLGEFKNYFLLLIRGFQAWLRPRGFGMNVLIFLI